MSAKEEIVIIEENHLFVWPGSPGNLIAPRLLAIDCFAVVHPFPSNAAFSIIAWYCRNSTSFLPPSSYDGGAVSD